jgi:hypothetical protein
VTKRDEASYAAESPLDEATSVHDILEYGAGLTAGQAQELPLISAAELCVLGAMNTSLVDEDVWSWWRERSEADRFRLSMSVLKFLVERGLLDPSQNDAEDRPGPEVRLRARPQLAVILKARTRPSFIVVQRQGADGDPRQEICMYGISDTSSGLRAVVSAYRFKKRVRSLGNVYLHALQSRAGCASSLAFSAEKNTAESVWEGLLRRRPTWMIDIYRPGDKPVSDRFEVARDGDMLSVKHWRTGDPSSTMRTSRDDLARLIEDELPKEWS